MKEEGKDVGTGRAFERLEGMRVKTGATREKELTKRKRSKETTKEKRRFIIIIKSVWIGTKIKEKSSAFVLLVSDRPMERTIAALIVNVEISAVFLKETNDRSMTVLSGDMKGRKTFMGLGIGIESKGKESKSDAGITFT